MISPRRLAFVLTVAVAVASGVAPGCGASDGERSSTSSSTSPASSSVPSSVPPSSSSSSTSSPSVTDEPGPEQLSVRVLDRRPHDTAAFTEGLVFDQDGRLFESVGMRGASEVREVDPDSGEVLLRRGLDAKLFGEGLAVGPSGLVQLTWQERVALTWSRDGLVGGPSFTFAGEGWGLTFDGSEYIQSDGSPTLTRRDATTFAETSRVQVTRGELPVEEINELEWVDGVLYANVWHSDEILRIDPSSGRVTGVIDASGLWQSERRTEEMTLNGIAHRPGDPTDELWLTGKNWPEMFRVRLMPNSGDSE